MTGLRVVVDTNVFVASELTKSDTSPTRELVSRWRAGKFELLFTLDTLLEYREKLLAKGVDETHVDRFLAIIILKGVKVEISRFHLAVYPKDADDIAFLLCALNGKATHLVSYDNDLLELATAYRDKVNICKPGELLADINRPG